MFPHLSIAALPDHQLPQRPARCRSAGYALLLALGLLAGCGPITVRNDPALSERMIAPTRAARQVAAPARTGENSANNSANNKADSKQAAAGASPADGLRLARLLRDQQRLQAASEVYAQLEQRQALAPLEMLEYASVAAAVQPPSDSLALFGRARRALASSTLAPAATATLCNGMGRARMALGQTDAALTDFDCSLKADGDNIIALNAKGVLLDAALRHTEARALFARASELAPADSRILNNLALSHLAANEPAQAVRLLRQGRAQAEAQAQPALTLNLALAYSLQGDEAAARSTLHGVMAAPLAAQALADFSGRRARIAAGAPVADELLAASRHLLALRESEERSGE